MKRFLVIIGLALTACAHQPKHYAAPDSAKLDASIVKMDASAERVHKAVVAAKATHAQVQTLVGEVKEGLKAQTGELEKLGPALDTLFHATPPELRDAVDAARQQVVELAQGNALLVTKVDTIATLQSTEAGQIEEANAGDKQHAQDRADVEKGTAAIKLEMGKLADAASAESAGRVAAENKVRELESKNWIRRALEVVAGLAILAIGFLWFTGKLTLSAAKVASRL